MKVNYGGFVPVSTVDWRGRAVCVVFLRGCPIRCSYCQNVQLQTGEDLRELDEVIQMIQDSTLLVTGVVFSGGEPTMQQESLTALCTSAKTEGLLVALQTNGAYPNALQSLISNRLIDRVALDIKTPWEWFGKDLPGNYLDRVKRSLRICKDARDAGILCEFEIVFTLFPGDIRPVDGTSSRKKKQQNPQDFEDLLDMAGSSEIVLQQGELKRPWEFWDSSTKIDGVSYRTEKEVRGYTAPLTLEELKRVADRMGRRVRIRTREEGEVTYAGRRNSGPARKR
ncbi:MAG: anaerobic ribonucleoside-triphosphate reductase activating protein [Methanoregulaceae archaeon]